MVTHFDVFFKKKEKFVAPSTKQKARPKIRPFYLNWRIWLITSLILVLIAIGVLAVVGPDTIFAIVIAAIAWVTGSGVWGAIARYVFPFLKDKVEKALEEANKAREEAREARQEAREEAKKISEKTETNSEDITFLRTSYEALGRQYLNINKMYETVMNDLQQERSESRLITAELRTQINTLIRQNQQQQSEMDRLKRNHQQEITRLNEQIRLMGVEKSSDKEKIIKLETLVEQLQNRVKELEEWGANLAAENKRLVEEDQELKANFGRRSTDKLTGLSPEAEARYNKLELDREKEQNQ